MSEREGGGEIAKLERQVADLTAKADRLDERYSSLLEIMSLLVARTIPDGEARINEAMLRRTMEELWPGE